MSDSRAKTVDLFSHTRYREFIMRESLENLVEFSLSMSRSCPPEWFRILSVSAPGKPGETRQTLAALTRR